MKIYEKLSKIQSELKVPKGRWNDFGKYYHRSCEDILEAAKPICEKYGTVLLLGDEIVNVGGRNYVRAVATLIDLEESGESPASISTAAFAREEETKKGMDSSQITGSTSSYARKYALGGLFALDDEKDSDETNKGAELQKTAPKKDTPPWEGKSLKERAAEARRSIAGLPTNADKIKQFAAALGVANSVVKSVVEKYAPGWKVEEMSDVAFNSTLAEIEAAAHESAAV